MRYILQLAVITPFPNSPVDGFRIEAHPFGYGGVGLAVELWREGIKERLMQFGLLTVLGRIENRSGFWKFVEDLSIVLDEYSDNGFGYHIVLVKADDDIGEIAILHNPQYRNAHSDSEHYHAEPADRCDEFITTERCVLVLQSFESSVEIIYLLDGETELR